MEKVEFERSQLPRGIMPKLPFVSAIASRLLTSEVSALPLEQKLVSGRDFDVYYARAQQIPLILHEIGRTREITFRAIGEGSGKHIDLDEFDTSYLHLFLWDRVAEKIAGAYRMGLSDEIMQTHGKYGFYSQSCFKMRRKFFNQLGPSIELGRSYIRLEYQKSIAPLLLLWKGIGRFIVQNPQYQQLFGPVSMSNEYCPLSRQLMVDYFTMKDGQHLLAKYVKPRCAFQPDAAPFWLATDLEKIQSFSQISELISLLENDGKGAPVLYRHYLNMGGRIVSFSVDHDFGSSLDGLVVVDLLKTNPLTLKRYMGNDGLSQFYRHHQTEQ